MSGTEAQYGRFLMGVGDGADGNAWRKWPVVKRDAGVRSAWIELDYAEIEKRVVAWLRKPTRTLERVETLWGQVWVRKSLATKPWPSIRCMFLGHEWDKVRDGVWECLACPTLRKRAGYNGWRDEAAERAWRMALWAITACALLGAIAAVR